MRDAVGLHPGDKPGIVDLHAHDPVPNDQILPERVARLPV